MNATNRYTDYFVQLQASYSDLPPDEFKALLHAQLEQIEGRLADGNYDQTIIDHEMGEARAAAEPWLADVTPVETPAVADERRDTSLTQEESPASPPKARAGLTALLSRRPVVLLSLLFALTYVSAVSFFLGEGHPTLTIKGVGDRALPVDIRFVTVDLARDSATLFVTPLMSSPAVAQEGRLKDDITIEIDTGDQVLSHFFKAGTVPLPWHAVIPFEYGDQLDYPFDRHGGDFLMRVVRGNAGEVPLLDIDRIAHGFALTARAEPTADGRQLDVTYEVTRSNSVVFVALIGLVSLTLVCFSAVTVAWQVARKGRKVEFSMMVWIAALLFVIPTVRNGMPGGPPHGALIDISLIYWLHFFIVGALLTVVRAWTRQP